MERKPTVAKDVIPMYDQDQQVNAYCVLFETDGADTGYVIISTDINAPLVSEFSDHAQPAIAGPKTRSSGNDTVYYGGPLNYGTDAAEIGLNNTLAENSDFAQQNISYLSAVSEAMAAEPTPMAGDIIQNPVDYLKKMWPNYVFSNVDYDKIPDSTFPAYIINGENACAMYGIAALITFHCKSTDGISIEKRAEKIKQLAIENGYVKDSTNYYLDNGKYTPFGNLCLNTYGKTKMATLNSPFSWTSGKAEISRKRPILLNIWKANGGYYSDHTVAAYGWTVFDTKQDMRVAYNFFKVRDGYNTGDRYVSCDSINFSYITKMN